MSLLEVVVSIAMFSSVILATITTFDATGGATVAVGHRASAIELASSALEEMRAVPYDRLGLSPGADGYSERFEGNETVAVSNALVVPRTELRRGTADYTVVRNVTWGAVTMSSGRRVPAAVKLLTVVVSWRDSISGGRGTDQAVRLHSARAASGPVAACMQRSIDTVSGPLRGVVNLYVPGSADVAAGATVVPLDPAAIRGNGTISSGDLVLVMQVGGTNAGRYEYALATGSILGGHLGVTGVGAGGGLALGYSATDLFQVVRVPTYGDATIDGVTAAPWDGRSGGVAAVDVAGTATLSGNRSPSMSASGAGFSTPAPSGVLGAADRLVMGGVPAPRGAGGSVGGGIVLLRATAVAAVGRLAAGAHGAADGGTVGVFVENGDLDSVDAEARGAGRGTAGGFVLAGGDLRSVANDAAGRPGTTRIPTAIGSLTGVGLGVGCGPAVSIDVSTTTPVVATSGPGATATWSVRLSNSRATAKSVTIDIVAPSGWRLLGGSTVTTGGGATRAPVQQPRPADVPSTWGVLSIPARGTVVLTASFRVPVGTAAGAYSPLVTARHVSPLGNAAVTFPGGGSSAEDVTVTP